MRDADGYALPLLTLMSFDATGEVAAATKRRYA